MFDIFKKSLILAIFSVIFIICLSSSLSAAQKKHIIVIDPAHGGQDDGVKLTDKITEKNVTLAIALAIQKELARETDFEVVLTRNSDKSATIDERRNTIFKIKPELLLSLHTNAGFGKEAEGFELYYPGFRDLEVDKKLAKKNIKNIKNKYLNDSVKLANLIKNNLYSVFPRKWRELREADVPILEGVTVPGLVVEIGFATNNEDKKKLLSERSQTEIAKALAKSIVLYFR